MYIAFVTAPQMTTDERYTSDAHRAAAADESAPEGRIISHISISSMTDIYL